MHSTGSVEYARFHAGAIAPHRVDLTVVPACGPAVRGAMRAVVLVA